LSNFGERKGKDGHLNIAIVGDDEDVLIADDKFKSSKPYEN